MAPAKTANGAAFVVGAVGLGRRRFVSAGEKQCAYVCAWVGRCGCVCNCFFLGVCDMDCVSLLYALNMFVCIVVAVRVGLPLLRSQPLRHAPMFVLTFF